MTVKIIIKRTVSEDKEKELTILLKQLRNLGVNQTGYISGETLKNIEKPNEFLVISTWRSADDWNRWVRNDKRKEIQEQIDFLLGVETEYGIYDYA
jgi:heme-degrading monooxygenase HmoA